MVIEFHTKELIGEPVIVMTRDPNLKFMGIVKEFFERNDQIVLEDYTVWVKNEEKEWNEKEAGDILVLQRSAWFSIQCPSFSKKRKKRQQ